MLRANYEQPPVGEEWRGGWRMSGWMVFWFLHDRMLRGISVPRHDFNFGWIGRSSDERFGWFTASLVI